MEIQKLVQISIPYDPVSFFPTEHKTVLLNVYPMGLRILVWGDKFGFRILFV